ncbi:MAG: serine/threonine-protein kinase [Myxococcota bacterium]
MVDDLETLDAEAAAIRASVRRRLFGEDAPMKIGRFDVVAPLGRGGMGVVYEVNDPQLDRRAAVKVLRPPALAVDADPARAQRLLREAQAVAKLSHPNVVTVYEVGAIGDAVYMAMELVEGQTLRQWVKASSRGWREIVEIFVQAGRGLAAAHAVGLVHRDFKPDNVMIDGKGRVRVLDFGLARLSGLDVSVDGDTLEVDGSSPDVLTVTGMVLGTPAYMAPEQKRSRTAVPASDQYSLCVTLYEALYGERPPRSDEVPERLRHPTRRGPAALRRIIDRGLRRRPHQRFESIEVLVDRLQRLVEPRRFRWLVGAAGLGAAAATALAWPSLPAESADDPCPAATQQTQSIWNSTRREAIATHFAAARRGFAEDAWPKVEQAVDQRVSAWNAAADETCHATRVAGTQSEDVRLWRSLCLQSQLTRLDSLLDVLQRGDAVALVQATSAVAALDDVASCDAEQAGRSNVRWPEDPATIQALQELDLELSVANAERDDNRLEDAMKRTDAAVLAAEQIGFAPFVAKALRVQADLNISAGHAQEAETILGSAIEQGEAGRDDTGVATAWITLVHVVGEELARLDDAKRMFALANGALQRAGDPRGLRSRWMSTKASIHDLAGEFDAAVEGFESALALAAAEHGEAHPYLANVLHGYSRALLHRGDAKKALAVAQRAQAIAEASLGPRHPAVATHLTSIGNANAAMGERAASIVAFERALQLNEAAYGPQHPRVGALHSNLGNAYMQSREPDLALPHFERAVEVDRATLGESHPHRAPALYGLALVHLNRGELGEAEPLLQEGLDIVRRAWGKKHPDQSYLLAALADVKARQGEPLTAIAEYREVYELLAPTIGDDHPRLVPVHAGIARANVELGRHDDAIEAFEAAMKIVDTGRNAPLEAAEIRFDFARILHAEGRDPTRVLALADAAHEVVAAAGPPLAARSAEIAAWRAEIQ